MHDFFYGLPTESLGISGACNIPLERYWECLSNGILHAPIISKIADAKQKSKYVIV